MHPKCEIEDTKSVLWVSLAKVDLGSKLESMTLVVLTIALSHLKMVISYLILELACGSSRSDRVVAGPQGPCKEALNNRMLLAQTYHSG